MYREVLVPVDNSEHSGWAVDRAIELCLQTGGEITANHVYAARLHDVRFRQLESGIPGHYQQPDEIQRQRDIHDKLIEKGLQLISDSFLDQVERRCRARGVALRRQLLEGSNFAEIIAEANSGSGRLPLLIGFDRDESVGYDGGECARPDIVLDDSGHVAGDSVDGYPVTQGSSGRNYDLVIMGAHGLGRQEGSQLGSVVNRASREIEKDLMVLRTDAPLSGGAIMVCVDGSAYSYRAMTAALELARTHSMHLYVCSAFDVAFHHSVFQNIQGVLSERAARVFKFDEQQELHNTIIDKGLLKLCQANIKRAEVLAESYPEVEITTQVLIGKPFQSILKWAREIEPALLVVGRHGSHRIEGTSIGSQAENLLRLADCNVLITGTTGILPHHIPRIEDDEREGIPWTPQAEARIERVPLFAQGIARRGVEEFVMDLGETVVTDSLLDRAIRKLLPTHMQLIMGLGDCDELSAAESQAEQQLALTLVIGSESDAEPRGATVEDKCPGTGRTIERERCATDPAVWTEEAFARLGTVPLIARPMARNTVERFARERGLWRVTTAVMDENKSAMIQADEFDAETMMGMFRELRANQISSEATRAGGFREPPAAGSPRCPIRDIETSEGQCPIDHGSLSPDQAEARAEQFLADIAAKREETGKAKPAE